MPLVFSQALPSSTIDPRQSTTVPNVSKTSAFTGGTCARASSPPRKATAIPAAFKTCLRVMEGLLAAYYTKSHPKPWNDFMERQPGDRFGPHELVSAIGKGGM